MNISWSEKTMFWADEIVEKIIAERPKKEYVVTDWKTPSGRIHIGALRGVVLHDAITRGLRERGKKVRYIYGFDSFDPVDSLPEDLKKSYGKYMGVPLSKVPSPEGKAASFAKLYGLEFENVYRQLGVKSETIWIDEFYQQGKYDKAIKIVLEKAHKIRQIYKEVSGSEKAKDWFPIQVVCPKCGKVGTTKVTSFDGKEVEFECVPDIVDWARGCGEKGKISPFGGNAKMPYKVDIAAKWFTLGTDFEAAGKDHYTKGGTFDVAKEIAEQVFKIKPAMGFGYEWFLVGGKKMSTSRGVGSSAVGISKILPPEILRFLLLRTKAKRTIDFEPSGNTIPDLFDEFDRAADSYFVDEKADLSRALYYGLVDEKKLPPKFRYRFSKVAWGLQMWGGFDIKKDATKEKGSKLKASEADDLKKREKYAKLWLDKYASEDKKITLYVQLPEQAKKLTAEQKEFLKRILTVIENKKLSGEELHQEIHKIKEEQQIDPRVAFAAIYLPFFGKDSGPKAGWFLAALDKKLVVDRLNEVIK